MDRRQSLPNSDELFSKAPNKMAEENKEVEEDIQDSKKRRITLPARSILRGNEEVESESNTITLETEREYEVESSTSDQRKKIRKTVGRRVSFAATAHVRLFDKENEDWKNDGQEGSSVEHEDKETPLFSLPPEFDVSEDKVVGESLFQIPDLSSVARTSNAFDLRLSLDESKSTETDTSYHSEGGSDAHDRSFEINVKGFTDDEEDVLGGKKLNKEDLSVVEEENIEEVLPQDGSTQDLNLTPSTDSEEATLKLDSSDMDLSESFVADKDSIQDQVTTEVISRVEEDIDTSNSESKKSLTSNPITHFPSSVSWGIPSRPLVQDVGFGGFGGFGNHQKNNSHHDAQKIQAFDMFDRANEHDNEDETESVPMDLAGNTGEIPFIDSPSKPSIRRPLQTQDVTESLPMDETKCLGGIIEQKEPHDFDEQLPAEDVTMEITECIGAGVESLSQSSSSKTSHNAAFDVTDATLDQSTHEQTESLPMDLTQCVGGIQNEKQDTTEDLQKDLKDNTETIPMDFTQCLGGIVNQIDSSTPISTDSKSWPISSEAVPSGTNLTQRFENVAPSDEFDNSDISMEISTTDIQESENILSIDEPSTLLPLENTPIKPAAKSEVPNVEQESPTLLAQKSSTPPTVSVGLDEKQFEVNMDDSMCSAQFYDTEENILHQELPETEFSFDEQSKKATPVGVEDFLKSVGVSFREHELPQEDAIPLEIDDKAPSPVDYVQTSAVLFSELQLLEFCCQELKQNIMQGTSAVQTIEKELNEDPSPLMKEYYESSDEIRGEIASQFNVLKQHSDLATKYMWYNWREKLLSPVISTLKETLENLKKDSKQVVEFKERIGYMLTEIQDYSDSLTLKLQQEQSLQESELKDQLEQLENLQEAIAEQNSQLDIFKKEQNEIASEEEKLLAKLRELENQKNTLVEAIDQANTAFEDLKFCSDEDLTSTQEEYSLLESLFSWKPVHVSSDNTTLIYDNAIQVSASIEAFTTKRWDAVVISNVSTEASTKDNVSELGLNWLRHEIQKLFENSSVVPTFSEVLSLVASRYHTFQAFEKDIVTTRYKLPIEISMDQEGHFDIHALFFGPDSRTKFFLKISVDLNDLNKLNWSFEHVYGAFKDTTIRDIIQKTSPQGFQSISSLCFELRKYVQ
ncbi:hypothetical protein K7432_003928 [Basidiobolus ranarum]|uniref:Spc7 kinetochore protein domain-containing protein n=1 Tax=Basidiobolus ranarum TaxID=34480 RepID=A0ABR2W5G7_9FUNG